MAEALCWLREHPQSDRIIYFYIVDEAGRLEGVVPARSLILSPPETPLADVMIRKAVALPASASVLEACEFFIQHRLLAFPVVDDQRRVLGVVDVDLYTQEPQVDRATPPGRRLALPAFVQMKNGTAALHSVGALICQFSLAGFFQAFWRS